MLCVRTWPAVALVRGLAFTLCVCVCGTPDGRVKSISTFVPQSPCFSSGKSSHVLPSPFPYRPLQLLDL